VAPTDDGFDVEDTVGATVDSETLRFKFRYVQQEATWVLIEADDERRSIETSPEQHIQRPYDEGRVIRFDAFKGDEFGVAWAL
jgi:hypothetical protein